MASLNWHDLFRKEDLNELCDCGIDVYSGNRLRQLIIEFARKQGDDVQVIVDSESLNYYASRIACSIILARIENPDISLEQAACRPAVKELALSLINDYIAEHRFIKEGYALDAKKGWITVHPNGDDKKGQHILIDPDTGIVLGGAGGKFNGMHISQMCKHYPAPSATHKVVAQKAGNVSTKAAPSSGQSKAATNASYGTINGTTQHGVAPQSTPATSASGQSSGSNHAQIAVTMRTDEVEQRVLNEFSKSNYLPFANAARTDDVDEDTALSINKPRSDSDDYFLLDCWMKECHENLALANSPRWLPRIEYDLPDPELRDEFNKLQYAVERFAALKRHANFRGQPLPHSLMQEGTRLERQFQTVLTAMNARQATLKAHELSNFAQKVSSTVFHNPLVQASAKSAAEEVFTNDTHGNMPSSLLSMIGAKNRMARTSIVLKYDDPLLYFTPPKSAEEIANAFGLSNNPAFNNLLNAKYLYNLVKYDLKLSKQERTSLLTQAQKIYYDTLKLYQNGHGGLPLITCFNRDMAVIAQREYGVDPHRRPNIIGATVDTPMSFEEADHLCSNPHYDSGLTVRLDDGTELKIYQHNCQSCVVAYELRRRGIDVAARPNPRNNKNNAFDLSYHPNLIWRNPVTGTAPDIYPLDPYNIEAAINNICSEGERYHLMFDIGDSGHIITFERENGLVRIYDPQNGEVGSINEYFGFKYKNGICRKDLINNLYYYRVDNCDIFDDYANKVVTKPTPQPTYDSRRVLNGRTR